MAQVVEHILGKDEVGSSSLPNSSKIPSTNVGGIFLLKYKTPEPFNSGVCFL